MDRNLGGIKAMKGIPSVMFVIDPKREHIAINEARKLRIPVVALCDTNCDPTGIEHVIPGNDDALKSIRLFTGAIADAVIEGRSTTRAKKGAYSSDSETDGSDGVQVVQRRAPDAPAPAAEAAAPEAPAEAAPPAAPPEA